MGYVGTTLQRPEGRASFGLEGRTADANPYMLSSPAGDMVSENGLGHADGQVLAKEAFPADLGSLALIREFVGRWAEETGADQERTSRIQLAVNEACANVVDHAKEKSDVTLWAWNRQGRFTVDVWHAGEFEVKTGQDRHHRGMGLPLMVASADEVSFACLPEGGTRVSLSVFLK